MAAAGPGETIGHGHRILGHGVPDPPFLTSVPDNGRNRHENGPFALWGEPVVQAAIVAGCHYVDTAGEQAYIRHILDTAGPAAERAEVTVVPAMADDGGPGDLIAHLTAGELTNITDLLVVDARRPGAASRGTARSMATVGDMGPLEYVGGTWRPETRGESWITVPGEDEEVALTPFALPGVVTVPRHVRAGRVRSGIRTEVAELFASLTPDVVDSIPEAEGIRTAVFWIAGGIVGTLLIALNFRGARA